MIASLGQSISSSLARAPTKKAAAGLYITSGVKSSSRREWTGKGEEEAADPSRRTAPSTMSDGQGNTGGYFIGRPANTDEPNKEKEQQPQPVAEPPQTVNEPLPGDYFVGRPANQQQDVAPPPAKPGFMAKLCPCLAGGGATS